MHQYLKAIGFENIQTRKDLKKLLKDVEENLRIRQLYPTDRAKISANSRKSSVRM